MLSYGSVMTRREVLQTPSESLEFSPIEWSGLSLTAGTVLRFTHALTDKVITFQCVEDAGHKKMGGVLTETTTDQPGTPIEAVLETSNPNAEVIVPQPDGGNMRILPAYTLVEAAFDEQLLFAATQQPEA